MSISGGLDLRQQINFKRSMRLWQPILTFTWREDILIGKYAGHYKNRLTKDRFLGMLRATSLSVSVPTNLHTITAKFNIDHHSISFVASLSILLHEKDIDAEAIVTYNSFDSLLHYYSEMSAMGDREPEFQLFGPTESASPRNEWGRIGNVSIPFAFLMALDDPIVGWRTLGTTDLKGLVNSGSGNIMLSLTKSGGHVVRFRNICDNFGDYFPWN